MFTDQRLKEEYECLDFISDGSFSKVYHAKSKPHQTSVAIKHIKLYNIFDQHMKQLVSSEGDLLRSISHPNVIAVLDMWSIRQEMFIILEYCQMSLYNMVKKYFAEGLPEKVLIPLLKELFQGVQAIHSESILHRDIKSQNLLLQSSNEDFLSLQEGTLQPIDYISKCRLKIIDLGMSVKTKTYQRSLVGTFNTMAPEVINNQEYDSSADIYSLGVVTYQLVSGRYDQKNQKQIDVERLRCSQSLKNLIIDMLNTEPQQRPNIDMLLAHNLFLSNFILASQSNILIRPREEQKSQTYPNQEDRIGNPLIDKVKDRTFNETQIKLRQFKLVFDIYQAMSMEKSLFGNNNYHKKLLQILHVFYQNVVEEKEKDMIAEYSLEEIYGRIMSEAQNQKLTDYFLGLKDKIITSQDIRNALGCIFHKYYQDNSTFLKESGSVQITKLINLIKILEVINWYFQKNILCDFDILVKKANNMKNEELKNELRDTLNTLIHCMEIEKLGKPDGIFSGWFR